jgi:hypothetical protein
MRAMALVSRLPAVCFEKSANVAKEMARFAKSRARGQRWAAFAATLILSICVAEHNTAQAATIQVTTKQQGVSNGLCSLQEAIYSSEFKLNKAVDSTDPDHFYMTGCVPGTGDDIIVLLPGADFTFDHSWDGDAHNIYGPTATPIIFSTMYIDGNGATLEWVSTFSPGNSRLFAIGKVNDPGFAGTGTLTLSNVYVKGFHIKGGDGGNGGGGGGLGAGGAIYVDNGSLIVVNSTFENNGAVGGNGGGSNSGNGIEGGGGGLSGKGGDGCPNSGGGGGGSRGNGGRGPVSITLCLAAAGGGGGGGTVFSGGDGTSMGADGIGGSGGFRCGGNGGDAGNDAHEGACSGGGGGGGGGRPLSLFSSFVGDGAPGHYGGGGGGGAGDGGSGGFGGGGGAGNFGWVSLSGGNGGFGGGGGAANPDRAWWTHPGRGGTFGGRADGSFGGGGGALGGAIFNHKGTVVVNNSTFFNNSVTRGVGGGGPTNSGDGGDAGGAIFSFDNTLDVRNSTFSGNQSTGSGAAIVVYTDEGDAGGTLGEGPYVILYLYNTIIANNGANECYYTGGAIIHNGLGNLIMRNGSGGRFSGCPGVVTTSDPQLQPLQLNSGPGNVPVTPTMAILPNSFAASAADSGTSLPFDQRFVVRPPSGDDIGAYETSPGERK